MGGTDLLRLYLQKGHEPTLGPGPRLSGQRIGTGLHKHTAITSATIAAKPFETPFVRASVSLRSAKQFRFFPIPSVSRPVGYVPFAWPPVRT